MIIGLFLLVKNTKSCLNKQKVPDAHCRGLRFCRPVWFLFPNVSGCGIKYETKNEKSKSNCFEK